MESVKVRIKGSIVTNRFGALSDGDIVKTDEAYAKHLVDKGVAEYEGQPPQAAQQTAQAAEQETAQAVPSATPQATQAPEPADEEQASDGARQVGQSNRRRKAE